MHLGGWLTAQTHVKQRSGPEHGKHGRVFINLAVAKLRVVATAGGD